MSVGPAARSLCNPPHQVFERMAAERERTAVYYVALYAEMERCRVARAPMLIGADLGYQVPNAIGNSQLENEQS